MNDWKKLEDAKKLITEVQTNLAPPGVNLPPRNQWVFRQTCNLWIPESENDKKLVVLIRGDWDEPDKVEAKLRNGDDQWERLRYSGVANPCNGELRYHFRGTQPGGPHYAGIQKNGGVRVWYGNEYAFIPLETKPSERSDGRTK